MAILSNVASAIMKLISHFFSSVLAPLLSHLFQKKDGDVLEKLPGPEGLPLVGNALSLIGTDFHRVLLKWGIKYGTMFKINVFGTISVVVSDLEVLEELLATPPKGVPKNLPLYTAMNNLTSPVSNESIMTYKDFDHWKFVRASLDPSFTPDTLASMFPTIKAEVSGVVAQLRKNAAEAVATDIRNAKLGLLVDTGNVCVRMTLNMTGSLCYDMPLGLTDNLKNESPIIKALMRARVMETNKAKNPFSKFVAKIPFLAKNRQHKTDLQLIHGVFASAGEHLRGMTCPVMKGKAASIPCALHNLKDWKTGQAMPKDEMNSNTGLLGVAGSFPAALVATYALYEIAAHPPVQNKIEAELATARVLGKPEDFTYETMAKLKYLDNAVKEATRFHPIVPQVNRVADRDLVLKDYNIPKGTQFFIGLAIIHNSPKNFTDPDKYWPGRWDYTEERVKREYGKGGDTATPIGNINNIPGSFIPFSSGNRICLGRDVAWLQATTIVAQLIAGFRVSLDSTTPNPEGIIKEESFAITINPGKPIQLRFTPRE